MSKATLDSNDDGVSDVDEEYDPAAAIERAGLGNSRTRANYLRIESLLSALQAEEAIGGNNPPMQSPRTRRSLTRKSQPLLTRELCVLIF